MLRRKTLFIIFFITIVALVLWRSVNSTHNVTASVVSRGTAVDIVYATGEVEPVEESQLSFNESGRLTDWYHDEGETVKQGMPLAALDDVEEKAEVARLESLVDNDRTEAQRAQTLWEKRSGSKENLDRANSILAQDEARLKTAHEQLAKRQIVAPYDGIILRRERERGETIAAGQMVFVIGKPDRLRLSLDVDEEDIPHVFVGQKALISADAFPRQIFEGRVHDITPRGDTLNKSYRVRVYMNDGFTMPLGMTVEANLVAQEHENTQLIPHEAVINDESVFKVENNRSVKTSIKTGISNSSHTEVLTGLKDGDVVITSPPDNLKNGDRVNVKIVPLSLPASAHEP